MAWFGYSPYFIALLYYTEILSHVMSEYDEDAYEFFLCFRRQICECEGGVDNYRRCYSLLKEKYPCSVEMEAKLREKADELGKHPMTTRESNAIESSRGCIMPNLSMCMDNPEDCL
ncbi:uncharacterized protein LOC118191994 [Stegodyphus dumicola]|uniref:uncharacterized protein LOC118191994 n=1 Tax=Stegodyphus dumicola TaxID=202533 RepID=UPI0015A8C1F4|nr:uncharacterized protein LOC118191994 [Stegodyphus dumicola]